MDRNTRAGSITPDNGRCGEMRLPQYFIQQVGPNRSFTSGVEGGQWRYLGCQVVVFERRHRQATCEAPTIVLRLGACAYDGPY